MTPGLLLDRMALDDVGGNPVRLARAIHQQLGEDTGAVPVFEIAKALDIVDIRHEPLRNFEGALITPPERGWGSILVNSNSSRQRQRFTAGHELLHFLSPLHRPSDPDGFRCSRRDMIEHQVNTSDRHRRQEAEANAFAIELLAPRSRIRRYLGTPPDLEAVVSMSGDLDISKEAAARRYVECHDETLAVVFSLAGRVVYSDSSSDCPALAVQRGESLPELSHEPEAGSVTAMEDASAADWLWRPRGVEMAVQTLYQREGRAITLIYVLAKDEDTDDGGVEDTYSRFSRFDG